MDRRSRARTLLLDRFRWTDGHADIADMLRDPELLRTVGPRLWQHNHKTAAPGIRTQNDCGLRVVSGVSTTCVPVP